MASLFFGFLALVLMNVDSSREIGTPARVIWTQLLTASGLSLVYTVQDLITRYIVLDPAESIEINLGYVAKELTLLAFVIFVSGFIMAGVQDRLTGPNPWIVCGPLLALRHLYELTVNSKSVIRVGPR